MDYQKFVNNASFTIFVAVVSKQGRAKKNCY